MSRQVAQEILKAKFGEQAPSQPELEMELDGQDLDLPEEEPAIEAEENPSHGDFVTALMEHKRRSAFTKALRGIK